MYCRDRCATDEYDSVIRRLEGVENKNLDQDNAIDLIRDTMPNANVVDTLTIDVDALKDEKLDNAYMDEDIHFGPITITKDGTAVIASLEAVNPITGVVTPLNFLLPGATSTEAGVMDASSVAWITEAEARISALEGLSDVKAIVGLDATPTQAEINSAWMDEVGKAPETGDFVQDVSNAKLWVYVTDTWTLYSTLMVVPLATTTSLGGVKDTALNAPSNRWYGHVEADGRLSLIGGDSLSTLVDTTIPALQAGVNNSVKKTGDTMGGRLYANGGVSIESNGEVINRFRRNDITFNNPWSMLRREISYDKDHTNLFEVQHAITNSDPRGPNSRMVFAATTYTVDKSALTTAVFTLWAFANGEKFATCNMRPSPGPDDVITNGYLVNRLTTKQDKLTFDSSPVSGSANPVTSGGVKAALDTKASKTDVNSGLALKVDKGSTITASDGVAVFNDITTNFWRLCDDSNVTNFVSVMTSSQYLYCYISPDGGSTSYTVCKSTDAINNGGYTSHTIMVPKNWAYKIDYSDIPGIICSVVEQPITIN